MTAKQRCITALERGIPDRLPVTTHQVMPYFTDTYMNGISDQQFFDHFGLDPIIYPVLHRPDAALDQWYDPDQNELGFSGVIESRRIVSDSWRVTSEPIACQEYKTTRHTIWTPSGELTMVLQDNGYTSWVTEPLVKKKRDIEIIGSHMTSVLCDTEAVNAIADEYGDRGLVRAHICSFEFFGQPGCWQDACCLFGTQQLIMETFDDPSWVHSFLRILQHRKLIYTRSLAGARYDLLELGGGDASTSVISPALFSEFVAPYDAPLITAAHEAGQRIVYHVCGSIMPILEDIAAMGPDAMETFSPVGMGGDTDLREAKRRIGDQVCMIGGFDQGHHLFGCTERETREAVRRCFSEAGEGGGYILAPSDHFFDASPELIAAFADEAKRCIY